LPDRSQSIAEVLHGKPAQGAALTTSGRIVWAVEPVVGRSQQIIGAVYLQIPVSYELSSGPFIPSVTRILIVSSIFWLILMLSVGTISGFIMTRDLLSRLHRLVTATTRFADGDYSQRVQVTRRDEVGQLEAQFNRMAEQLIEGISQQQVLAEDNARLAERNRIARDLHDSIKQHIFAVSMQLETALTQFDTQPDAARQHLQEADSLAYHAQQELSMLIQELRPLALQSKGLEAALEDYVIAWSRQQRIAVELHLTKPCPLSPLIEEALWRVAQETLSNVARHSGATRVQVFLTCEQGKVTLTISDNGRGFDNSRVDKSGIGLYSMKERMEAVGGILRVEGTLGEGTRIYAQYSGCEVGVCPGLAVVPTSKEE
jgi:NarL family two-component system sensor histidine kinase LiaS